MSDQVAMAERPHLKRGPGGSSFMTCEGCGKSIGCAVFDLHQCSAAQQREEQLVRWAKTDKEHFKKEKEERRLKDANVRLNKKRKEPQPISGKAKKEKKEARDPNMPKRPQSSYMLFLNDFRPKFKEENPDVKGVTEVVKAGGAKWKSMSDEEKKPYVEVAARLKSEHVEQVRLYKIEKGLPVPEDEKENAVPEAVEIADGEDPPDA